MNDIEINPLIRNRYSLRAYASKPLSDATITKLFEAARWAASARNSQPWRFIYATPDRKETWDKLYDCLEGFNKEWVTTAPFLMMGLVQVIDPERKSKRTATGYQLGLAMGNFTMQASEMGVYIRNMRGFSIEKAKRNFGIPELYEPVIMVTAGYLGDESKFNEQYHVPKGEHRIRKPLDNLIFDGNWDNLL